MRLRVHDWAGISFLHGTGEDARCCRRVAGSVREWMNQTVIWQTEDVSEHRTTISLLPD